MTRSQKRWAEAQRVANWVIENYGPDPDRDRILAFVHGQRWLECMVNKVLDGYMPSLAKTKRHRYAKAM